MKRLWAAAVLSMLLGISTAHAQQPSTDALNRAREEFRRGLALEVAKDYEGALAVFKGVALVKSTPQVRFHIGVCEEAVGDWVGAIGSYRLALLEAREAKVKDVEEESQSAIDKLEPRIPKVTLVRGAGGTAARVVLDGRELGPASIGTAITVNPGPHALELTSPGHETTTIEFTAKEGESQEVALVLKARKAGEGGGSSAGLGEVEVGPSALLPVGITFLALGAASGVVSGVLFGMKQSAISDLDAECGADGQSCPDNLRETYDNGSLYSTISTATFIGALGAAGIGGTLLIIEFAAKPGAAKEKEANRPPVTVHGSPTGVTVKGVF